MDLKYSKCARAEQELKWAKIWARKVGDFHQRQRQFDWAFSADDVIAFLRSKRDAGVPAWKRMKIIEGLILFCTDLQKRSADELIPLREKINTDVMLE